MNSGQQWVTVAVNGKSLQHSLALRICNTYLSRLRGYLFSRPPEIDKGLLFYYHRDSRLESAIHMLGIGFPLGVVWVNRHRKVVDKTLALPWKPAYFPKEGASFVLECHPQRIHEFEEGDVVHFIKETGEELV